MTDSDHSVRLDVSHDPKNSVKKIDGVDWISIPEMARRLSVTPACVLIWTNKSCPILGMKLPTIAIQGPTGRKTKYCKASYAEVILAKGRPEEINQSGELWLSISRAAFVATVSEDRIRKWQRDACDWLEGRSIRAISMVVRNFPKRGRTKKTFVSASDVKAIADAIAGQLDRQFIPVQVAADRLGWHTDHVRRLTQRRVVALNRPLHSEYQARRDGRGNIQRMLCVSKSDVDQIIKSRPSAPNGTSTIKHFLRSKGVTFDWDRRLHRAILKHVGHLGQRAQIFHDGRILSCNVYPITAMERVLYSTQQGKQPNISTSDDFLGDTLKGHNSKKPKETRHAWTYATASAEKSPSKNAGGRPRKWDKLRRVIEENPDLSNQKIATQYNRKWAARITTQELERADADRVRRVKQNLRKSS